MYNRLMAKEVQDEEEIWQGIQGKGRRYNRMLWIGGLKQI